MKKPILYALLLGMGFVLFAAPRAKGSNQAAQGAAISQQRMVSAHVTLQADDDSEQASQTFTGTISKSEDKFVLVGEDSSKYNLDNQDKAKDFEGKKVTVTGTLDKDSNTIKVSEIQEAASDDDAG